MHANEKAGCCKDLSINSWYRGHQHHIVRAVCFQLSLAFKGARCHAEPRPRLQRAGEGEREAPVPSLVWLGEFLVPN